MYCHHGIALKSPSGGTLPGYFIECLSGETVVPIYADNLGSPIASLSGVTDRAKTDARGNFFFYVTDGTYNLKYYDDNGVYQFTETGFTMDGGGLALREDLADSSGAALIGTGSGGTVQSELNARATSAVLAATTGATLVGATGGGTVQSNLNARPTSATLADDAGSSLIGFIQSGTGAVERTAQSKLREVVSLFDFMTEAQIADVKAGTKAVDVTSAVQAAADDGRPIYAPAGTYKLTSSITFGSNNSTWFGAGMDFTVFDITAVTGPGFKVATDQLYFRPQWSDFSIMDTNADAGLSATSTIGFDATAMDVAGGGQIYNFEFRNIRISSGTHSMAIYACFSGTFNNVIANAKAGHGFYVSCGNSVTFINCYGAKIGTGKAAYRLAGEIVMVGCNGVDSGSWWGVFGKDSAASDGWQNDFPLTANDYPNVTIIGGNMEFFDTGGIIVHQVAPNFTIDGQKWDRAGKTTDYDSFLRFKKNSGSVAYHLKPGHVFLGTGVPEGPDGTEPNSYIYAHSQVNLLDVSSALGSVGVNYMICPIYGAGAKVPLVKTSVTYDNYQSPSQDISALTTRRLTAQVISFAKTALTPVGAGQALNVDGYTKALVTPAAAASVSTATFGTTYSSGSVSDYLRNGHLIIEAGNANLTINHTARGGGANTFFLTGGANLALASGQVVSFIWSETNAQWQQV